MLCYIRIFIRKVEYTMKKLIAILLSVLMLCSVIPFAAVSVSADDDHYIEIVADAEEVNAGDEVSIEVSLYGHEDLGIIGLLLELDFDNDVFELETYYDEDEELWMPPIEVGPKFSASSNKYIMFSPIDEETGYMERCLVKFDRALASATQAVKTNLYFTVTFKVKDDAPSGDYTIGLAEFVNKSVVMYGLQVADWSWEPITVTVNGSEPACEHANTYTLYTYGSDNGLHKVIVTCEDCGVTVDSYEEPCTGGTATCTECATCEKCGLNYGDTLPHEYFSDCDTVCMICGEETRPEAAHNVIHVEAKDATCTELGNIEYWYCDVCGMAWLDEACTQNTNLMSVKLPMVDHEYFYACDPVCMNCYEITNPDAAHSLSHVEAKDATCFENGNIEYWTCEHCGGCWDNEAATGMPLNQMMVVVPMAHDELTHVEAKAPTCFENGNIEYWTCEACGMAWLDAEGTLNTNLMAVVLPMAHNELTHVEAVAPTCFENGNIEYWYCEACGMAWLDAEGTLNTNLMAVVLPMAHNELTHVEAVAPTCYENGNIEYWYCEACGMAWLDAEGTLNTNLLAVVLPMGHGEITHVEAKDATCTELGNIEYWYCEACGQAWLDEACTLNTNLRAVVLPMAEHTYAGDCDTTCDACGAEREVILPAAPIAFGGNSISENKNGLAFLFTADVDGIIINDNYKADYSNATVIINGEEHKLVAMGAIMNNKGYAEQTLENVDGTYVLNVKANKVFDAASYAIRIVNIPAEQLDTIITARSYLTYECGGELITIYGEDIATSYNAELG